MKVWMLLASLVSLVVADSIILSAEERAGLPSVWVREVRKVSRPRVDPVPLSDYPLRDHNVKVVLDDHDHIPGVKRWKLAFLAGEEEIISTLDVEENIGSDQKELVFETALVSGARALFITARNSNDTVLATGSSVIKIPALESTLAWVGRSYNPSISSLRVDPGTLPQVEYGNHVCRQKQGPCYFLMEEFPKVIPRCIHLKEEMTDMPFDVCDDTMVPFRELAQPTDIEITDDLTLELTVPLPQDVIVESLEILAFDPRDPSVIFSPENFGCDNSGGELYPGKRCSQQLAMAKSQDLVSIMVVAFFGSVNGSLPYSTLISYSFNAEPNVSTGVIVGSVVGGLAALALVIGLVCFLR